MNFVRYWYSVNEKLIEIGAPKMTLGEAKERYRRWVGTQKTTADQFIGQKPPMIRSFGPLDSHG